MSYIFLDESGDLGFDFSKAKTTNYLVITFLFVNNKRPIEKVIKTIHRGLRKKYRMRDGMIHACKEEPVTCSRVCKKLSQKDCKVMSIYLNKKKVYTKLQDEQAVLYNYVTNILLDRILTRRMMEKYEPINFIASRRETNKYMNQNFMNYLKNQTLDNHKLDIDIAIKTPYEEKGLQAVDVLCWALFRKYEYGDDYYYNLFKNIIVEERPLLP